MAQKDKILNDVEKDLMEAEEFYIPIKKIWSWLREEYNNPPTLEELTKWLKADKRFVIHDIKTRDDEDDTGLEGMGYFSGPRIGLKKRQPTKEDMARIIAKHAGNVTKFLEKAYEVRPKDLDENEEKQLNEARQKAKILEEKIKNLFKQRKRGPHS